jgi:hypothetical protein
MSKTATTHTPGEWEAMPPKKTGGRWKVGAKGEFGGKGSMSGMTAHWFLATIQNGRPGDTLETEEANARVMAAAPDLLEACQAALEEMTECIRGSDKPEDPPAQSVMAKVQGAIAKATGNPV